MELRKFRVGLIDRYIMRRFLGTYIFAIALIIVIVVIFDAAEKIDDFMEAHVPPLEILTGYYLNFVPYFVNQFSALFTFIAVIFFTSKMAYDTEIIAILSSGVSFNRMMWPYFLSAAIIALLSMVLSMAVIPEANARRIAFDTDFMAKKNAGQPAYSANYDRHIFRQIEPNTFAYIRDFNPQTLSGTYLAVETYDGGNIVSSLQAQNPQFDSLTGRWSAPQYLLRTFEGEREILHKSTQPLDTAINLTAAELGKVQDLIQTMNSSKLRKFIKQQKAKGSDMVSLFEVESYSRVAYPISTFILTLIGVSLSSRKVRGGTGLHIGVGIALCFSYIVLMKFAGEFAKGGMLPPIISVWIPNILYALIGIYLYRRAPK